MLPAFDLETAWENVEGDQDLLNDLVQVLLEDTPGHKERIEQAVENGDVKTAQAEAQSLKSAVAVLGAKPAAKAAELLETTAEPSPDELRTLHKELKIEVDGLKILLQAKFSPTSSIASD